MGLFSKKKDIEPVYVTIDTRGRSENRKVVAMCDSEDLDWIWVDAYKGTNSDMVCRDMQYELGKEYVYDGDVELCGAGYHCCLDLKDVFNYYGIGNNNRFFKVRALVNKYNVQEYGFPNRFGWAYHDKLVAKKIVFVSEITSKELFEKCPQPYKVRGEQYYNTAREFGVDTAYKEYLRDKMIEVGYPTEVAEWLTPNCNQSQRELAVKIGDAPHMSLDTKYTIIFSGQRGE